MNKNCEEENLDSLWNISDHEFVFIVIKEAKVDQVLQSS